jgi:hypothetical protein
MPKFKKVIRKQGGGGFDIYQALSDVGERIPFGAIYEALGQIPKQAAGAARMATSMAPYLSPTMPGELAAKGTGALVRGMLRGPEKQRQDAMRPKLPSPGVPSGIASFGLPPEQANATPAATAEKVKSPASGSGKGSPKYSVDNQKIASALMAAAKPSDDLSNLPAFSAPEKNAMTAYKSGASSMADMAKVFKEAAKAPGASPELAKAAGEIPKTKAGMKKFMQDYGKFIALGAMAGAGGKGGQIAAPIMAALPGLIGMMRKKKSDKKSEGGSMKMKTKKFAGGGEVEYLSPNEIARRRMIMKDPSGASPAELRSLGIDPASVYPDQYKKQASKKSYSASERAKFAGSRLSDEDFGKPETEEGIMRSGLAARLSKLAPRVPDMKQAPYKASESKSSKPEPRSVSVTKTTVSKREAPVAPMPRRRATTPEYLDRDLSFLESMAEADPELMKTSAIGLPSLPSAPAPRYGVESEGESSELESMMSASSGKPKKSKFKRFMSGIGSFVKGKSSGGDTPKKSEGGAIRKFKGGSMNTKDSMLTPKYKKGGDMPKAKMGKAMGEMPQHKKMAMGKPTPQSTGQKFAKGGAAKYAGGGMCKGYGISKKIRPTGPMN